MVLNRFSPAFHCLLAITALAPIALSASSGLGWNADALSSELSSIKQLPAVSDDVTELKFSEFFKSPVGPRGLELTDKIKSLDGKRVRILGFMINQEKPANGLAMLAPYAFATHEDEYGLCDDLPSAVLFVHVPKFRESVVPHTPGILLLTGRLELGSKEEACGRISLVRLALDPEAAVTSAPASTVSVTPAAHTH